ncbi:MAG TPA: hypothetical protein VEH04_14250 [Verrucomicrobiae bacterium]|nr:hypothetical protein [Verrucomicrobiae bacterium]
MGKITANRWAPGRFGMLLQKLFEPNRSFQIATIYFPMPSNYREQALDFRLSARFRPNA